MKKYYIPTSSLNFNNILSTESISPKSFYDKRGFGYSRWFAVDENNIDEVIILYDTPHEFVRPQSDIEDHPMLVEITTDEEFACLQEGVYYSEKTIYLNPWQAKIIFFSEKVRTTVLSLSDSSLETKMVRLYKRQLIIEHFEGQYPSIDGVNLFPNKIQEFIEKDRSINKMKGLLYGYYIGANLSTSSEQLVKLNTLREIQNIFSSVVSNCERTLSIAQSERLNDLFSCLDRQHPLFLDLQQELGNKETVNKVLEILKKHGYELRIFNKSYILNSLRAETVPNPALKWVEGEIGKVNINASITQKLLDANEAQIIVSASQLISQKAVVDKEMNNLYLAWVNDVLKSPLYNSKISSFKASLSDEITKKAKEVFGDQWEQSEVRNYLNQLRRHIRGEEFNQEWNNGLLSSMAAVLTKGDDWESLLRFMQSKGMYDYRIAFSIYGVLNGFANITRDFTDLLLNQQSNYVADVFKEFYGQLLEKDIPTNISSFAVVEGNVEPTSEVVNKPIQDSSNDYVKHWRNKIRQYAESTIKKHKDKLLKSLDEAFALYGDKTEYLDFFIMLATLDGWKTGKNKPNAELKRLKEHFASDSVRNNKSHIEEQERTLWDIDADQQTVQQEDNVYSSNAEKIMVISAQTNNRSVIQDDSAYKYLETCDFLGTYISLIVSSFKEFQQSYRSGYYYKNQHQYQRNNNDVIDHFCKWCLSQKNKKALPQNPENRRMMDLLKKYLLKIYHD